MKKSTTHRGRPRLLALFLAACAVALVGVFAMPTRAFAKVIAHSVNPETGRPNADYSNIETAIRAGCDVEHFIIVMDADWDLGDSHLSVKSGWSLTIDMNGHKITSSSEEYTIVVPPNSTLNLYSSAEPTEIAYRGYARTSECTVTNQAWSWQDLTTTNTSGLVTNTSTSDGSGIDVYKDAVVNLDNVSIAGCGGHGIHARDNAKVNLKNTWICHNYGQHSDRDTIEHNSGAGIAFWGTGSALTMDNAHIDDNYSDYYGGGIWIEENTSIDMVNGSTISGNSAWAGGGINTRNDGFSIVSSDCTGAIKDNVARADSKSTVNDAKSGGGIHTNSCLTTSDCLIQGLTITGNYSGYDGGGIEADLKGTKIKDCLIADNYARCDGGGVFIFNKDCLIENCTIRDNYCDAGNGGYEGGGVFVSYHYDVVLGGTCVIKGNTRGKDSGNADDVFLSTISGGAGKAYITGTLAQGSAVGVRTGIEGDRRIASGFKSDSKDCLFMDLSSSYYVSYGTDEGGDAWQRHATKEFTLTVNGDGVKHTSGNYVVAYAPFAASGKHFWYWDEDKATGLYPATDYITGSAKYNHALSFTMPQNDVSLTAVFADTVKSAKITVEAPEVGKSLPSTAKLIRTDGVDSGIPMTIALCWYALGTDGSAVPATGNAQAGTTYTAKFSAQQSGEAGIFFDGGLSKENVTVVFATTDGEKTVSTESVEVASYVGRLAVTSGGYKTAGEKSDAAAETGTLKLQLMKQGLLDNGASSVAAVALDEDADLDGDALIDTVTLSYDKSSDMVAVSAPYLKGYNFCDWEEAVQSDWRVDDVEGVIEIPLDELESGQVIAYYLPVVTEISVGMPAPVANEPLASTCTSLEAVCSDGQKIDFTQLIAEGKDGFAVTWAPEAKTAEYSTTYTALIEIAEAPNLVDVENVLPTGSTVRFSNGVTASSAGFVLIDGKLCLAVAFPATADKDEKSDDADTDKGDESGKGDEKSDEDEKGDESGKDDEKSDESDKSDGDKTDSSETNEPQVTTTTTTTVTKAAKAKVGTPSTGDVTYGGIAGLLAVSAICLGAARVSRRKR